MKLTGDAQGWLIFVENITPTGWTENQIGHALGQLFQSNFRGNFVLEEMLCLNNAKESLNQFLGDCIPPLETVERLAVDRSQQADRSATVF